MSKYRCRARGKSKSNGDKKKVEHNVRIADGVAADQFVASVRDALTNNSVLERRLGRPEEYFVVSHRRRVATIRFSDRLSKSTKELCLQQAKIVAADVAKMLKATKTILCTSS